MVRKSRRDQESSGKRTKEERKSFELLSIKLENADIDTIKHHIFILIGLSILTKLAILFITPAIFHSFVDYFDLGFYFEHAVKLLEGQVPYVNYSFDYPVLLFVPVTIALVPAILFQNALAFVYTFQLLMIVCDIVTILCIYLIALKIWNEKTAYIAGLLYATAFSTAYFVLTKYDAFPTCLLMLAVLFTVYGMNIRGYLAAGLGFFTKIFPVIAFPFLILHNTKKSSLKDEILATLKVMVPISVVLMLPILIVRPEAIKTYLFASGGSLSVYANTLTYTLYSWLSGVFHLGIGIEAVSVAMYILMGITLLCLLYYAYTDSEKKPVTLLKYLLCALIALVVFTKFHSPQYLVWFTPLLCLLVADDINKILLFYAVQVFCYIEFPLMFGSFYTNVEYINPAGSGGWYLTLIFFSLQYLILLGIVAAIIIPRGSLQQLIGKKTT